ncbi:MAG: hypothetical protein JST30_12190 [Armatimonadetes bacterium]|nr:hypothetical protein [Armatimonadota bacterium]
MYFCASLGEVGIWRVNPTGQLERFCTRLQHNVIQGGAGMVFGKGGAFGSDIYMSDLVAGNILRITPDGTPTVFLSGLDHPTGMAFGPSTLYISEAGRNRILMFAPLSGSKPDGR